jgi:hypothetical protein
LRSCDVDDAPRPRSFAASSSPRSLTGPPMSDARSVAASVPVARRSPQQAVAALLLLVQQAAAAIVLGEFTARSVGRR